MFLSDTSPPSLSSFLYMGFTDVGWCSALLFSLLFSKRLALVFSLHSFPFLSFVFVLFLFFGRRSGAGGPEYLFYF